MSPRTSPFDRLLRPRLLAAWLAVVMTGLPATAGEFPDDWYFYGAGRPAGLKALEGKPAPSLTTSRWVGELKKPDSLRGKVVVVDFWGTWCGPCVRSIPKNVALVRKYGDDGLVFLGIHDSRRGKERIEQVMKEKKVNYPVAIDDGKSAPAWSVRFWPTYAVVDRKGIVRAAGLKPERVESVVAQLLREGSPGAAAPAGTTRQASRDDDAEPKSPGSSRTVAMTDADPGAAVPAAWLEGNTTKRARLKRVEAREQPPAIESSTWLNSEPLDLESLEGKVVLLDFWATWCSPCIASIPKMNELQQKYADQGLVVIGVCHPRGVERMPKVASEKGIKYAVCADSSGKMIREYGVDSYPDYYLIDRSGRLRVADCANRHVETAIRALLAE